MEGMYISGTRGVRPMTLRSLSMQEKTSEEGISKEAMGLRLESKQDTAEEGVTGRFQAEATICLYEGLEVNGDPC